LTLAVKSESRPGIATLSESDLRISLDMMKRPGKKLPGPFGAKQQSR
jgi:hypothetical protein